MKKELEIEVSDDFLTSINLLDEVHELIKQRITKLKSEGWFFLTVNDVTFFEPPIK